MSDTKDPVLFATRFLLHSSNRQPALTQLLIQPGSRDPGDASSLETVKIPNPGSALEATEPLRGPGEGVCGAAGRVSVCRPCVCQTHSCWRLEREAEARGHPGTSGLRLFRDILISHVQKQ